MIEEVTFPHPSILPRETSISLSKCVSSTCGCRWIHCPLCAPGRIGVGTRSFIQKHFDKIHELPSVRYNGYKLLVCLLKCATQKHYHCPKCGDTIPKSNKSRGGIKQHLEVCEGQPMQSSSCNMKIVKLEVDEVLPPEDSEPQVQDTDSASNPDVSSTVNYPHVSILRGNEELPMTPAKQSGQMMNVCSLCGATVKPGHIRRHRGQHMTSQIQWADCHMLGCSLLSCLGASASRRSRYQLHFHCPWCTDIMTDRRSALTHYSSRHADVEGHASAKRSRSPSSSTSPDERMKPTAKRFKPNGKIKDELSQTDLDAEEVFTKVTAVVSSHILNSGGWNLDQLCARLQLETGVSCDIQTGGLSLLGDWDQLDKARQLIRTSSVVNNKMAKTKSRTADHSSTSSRGTNKKSAAENSHNSVPVSSPSPTRSGSRRHLKTKNVALRMRRRTRVTKTRVKTRHKAGQRNKYSDIKKYKNDVQLSSLGEVKYEELRNQGCKSQELNSEVSEIKSGLPMQIDFASVSSEVLLSGRASAKGSDSADAADELSSECHVNMGEPSPLPAAEQGCTDDRVIIEKQVSETAGDVPVAEKDSVRDDAVAEISSQEDDNAATSHKSSPTREMGTRPLEELICSEIGETRNENMRHRTTRRETESSECCPACSEAMPLRQLIKHVLTVKRCRMKLQDLSQHESDGYSVRVRRLIKGMQDITSCTCPSCGTKRNCMSQVLYHYVAGLCNRNSENMRRNMEFFRAYGVIHDPLSKLYKCSRCNIQARKPVHLRNHIEAVHLPKIFSCPHCPRRFSTKEKKDYHMRVHVDLVKCEHCQKSFMKSYLMQHITKIHQVVDIKCSLCDFITKSEAYLRRHMENRHSSGHHLCEWCGKHFGQKTTMLRHVDTVHRGIKYKRKNPAKLGKGTCSICGQTMLKKNLNTHMQRRHEGLKLFACDICGASFTSKHSVKVHKLKHMSEEERSKMQKYSCDLCGQKFYKRYLQQEHIKAHGALYDCQKCGKHFRYRHSLLQHQRRPGTCRLPSDAEQVKCSLCSKIYPTQRRLENHMIREHEPVVSRSCETDTEKVPLKVLTCNVKEEVREPDTRTENTTGFIVQEVEEVGESEPIIQGASVEQILSEVNEGQDGMSLVWSKTSAATVHLQNNQLVAEAGQLVAGNGQLVSETLVGDVSHLVKIEDGAAVYGADLHAQTFTMIQSGEATEFRANDVELQPGEEFVMIDATATENPYTLQDDCVQYQCGHCNALFVSIKEVNAHVNLCHM